MNQELETIKDLWDKNTGEGRDELETRRLCDLYVAEHSDDFDDLREMSVYEASDNDPTCPDCGVGNGIEHPCMIVRSLSIFRNAGYEARQWECEVWLLHHFAPQQIGGPVRIQVRKPGLTNGS